MKSIAPFLLALGVAGCSRNEVAHYRVRHVAAVAKPAPAVATPPAAAPTMAAAPAAADAVALAWNAPATWKTGSASAMRLGSYVVATPGGDADLSVTRLNGAAGGELANLNRWRGQVQLPALSESEAGAAVARQSINGLTFAVVDFAGTGETAQRIVGAIVPVGGALWFFKLTGPAAVVAAAKPEFLEFLQTVKPSRS